jgi:PiT family inorganic phosphate transporter
MTAVLIVFVATAVVFDFLNGFHDSSNIVSTMISSRAVSPRKALAMTAVAEFCGPMAFALVGGIAVAKTIGHDVLAGDALSVPVMMSALVSAVLWNLLTWYLGIPSSSSHALIGGMLGSALCQGLIEAAPSSLEDLLTVLAVLKPKGMITVVTALFVSPPLGFLAGYVLLKLLRFVFRGATPSVNWLFKRGQVVTGLALALSHGTNDAQKTMGVISLGLIASGVVVATPEEPFPIPLWVVALSAGAIAIGTATGGWRLIRTLGGKFYKIRPLHGFDTQIASASVIFGAAVLGGPVSTTQVVSSAIMGAGSAERFSKVRWGVGKQIALAWLITIPATAVFAGLVFLAVRQMVPA